MRLSPALASGSWRNHDAPPFGHVVRTTSRATIRDDDSTVLLPPPWEFSVSVSFFDASRSCSCSDEPEEEEEEEDETALELERMEKGQSSGIANGSPGFVDGISHTFTSAPRSPRTTAKRRRIELLPLAKHASD
jgi:hypothetical protein